MTMRERWAPTADQAAARVRAAEDAWNLRDLEAVVRAYSIDCRWRDRAEFVWGREQVRSFLNRKWRRELDGRVINELWACDGSRIAIRFACEFRDDSGIWHRGYGNEHWECDAGGLIGRRLTSANEHSIQDHERLLRWPAGTRPAHHPALSELGL